jgi:hypothetical protein
MAFLIYKKTVADGNFTYERLEPLKFGGRDGLIAKHVKNLSEDELRSWQLTSAALLKLAGKPADDQAVLFDVAGQDSTSVCLYELVKVHGSCRDTSTQLALDFAVVIDKEIDGDAGEYTKSFTVPVPEKLRLLGETLSLSGGPGGGDWKWGTTPMQIGATVVNAKAQSAPHGHGSGEPCPSCTCGRRPQTA